jgi:hypothetical protein
MVSPAYTSTPGRAARQPADRAAVAAAHRSGSGRAAEATSVGGHGGQDARSVAVVDGQIMSLTCGAALGSRTPDLRITSASL